MSEVEISEATQVYTAQLVGQFQMFMNLLNNQTNDSLPKAEPVKTAEKVIIKEKPIEKPKFEEPKVINTQNSENDIKRLFTADIDELEEFYQKYEKTDQSLLTNNILEKVFRQTVHPEALARTSVLIKFLAS